MYGYEMIDTLRNRSNNVFELKAGTLYPLLNTLESKGFVNAYEDDSTGKKRKYYHITKDGRKNLGAKTSEWNEYQKAVANVLTFGEVVTV